MRSVFSVLAIALVSALFIASCHGGGGRTLWETNPQAGLLPAVQFAFTGAFDLTIDAATPPMGGYYPATAQSIGIRDDDTGASVIMLPDTYVSVDGAAPTWVNLGVGPLDKTPANTARAGLEKIGGAKILAETSLGSDKVWFSRNLVAQLPVVGGIADGSAVYVYSWNGSDWTSFATASQVGGFNVFGSLVTIDIDEPGNYAVFRTEPHNTGGGGGG